MSQITIILDSIFKTNGGTTRQWRTANEILLTHTDEIKKYCSYMKNKIRDLNRDTQLLALDFLDFSIDDGKIPLWTQVGSKEFLNSLVNIYKTRNDEEVKNKVLYLIQKWNNKFKKYNTIIPNFNLTYDNLKENEVEFPENMESTYEKYLSSGNNTNPNSKANTITKLEIHSESKNYVKKINLDLRPSSYERKYKRLVNKLDDLIVQIQDANVFMDKIDENGFDDDLRGICNDLETGKGQIVDTIESGKLKDEKLMDISVNVNKDIETTLRRWNDVKNGKKPQDFRSCFFDNQRNENNFQNNNNNDMNNNSSQNKGGFDLLGFGDEMNGNNNMNNNNNNLGNDLFDVFSGNNNNTNMNNNNQGNDFFGNMGNNISNNNAQNNNQNLFDMNNNNISQQNNQNNFNNNNFFGNNNINNTNNQNFQNQNTSNNNQGNDFFSGFGNNNNNQNNNMQNNNQNFFNNNINQNQNNQNQNIGNNDLFSQLFNNNQNNNNINNLQNNLNSVYSETNQFGSNFMNMNMNNNINNNNNNMNNINNNINMNNNINNNMNNNFAFNSPNFSNNNNINFNLNDDNKNKAPTSNKDFNFNF